MSTLIGFIGIPMALSLVCAHVRVRSFIGQRACILIGTTILGRSRSEEPGRYAQRRRNRSAPGFGVSFPTLESFCQSVQPVARKALYRPNYGTAEDGELGMISSKSSDSGVVAPRL